MKKRFIACIIACALLLMGTGYAYWTDLFTIKGTVDTGNLYVKLTSQDTVGAITDYKDYKTDLSSEYSKASANKLSLDDKKAEVQINEMYPGYAYKFKFKAKNAGTVAAKLSSILVNSEFANDPIKGAIGINIRVTVNNKTYEYVPVKLFGVTLFYIPIPVNDKDQPVDLPANNEYDFAIRDVRFKSLKGLSKIDITEDNLLLLDSDLFILPDTSHEMEIVLTIGMDPDADGEFTNGVSWLDVNNKTSPDVTDIYTEDQLGTLTLKFLWDQYNAPEQPLAE